MASIEDIILNIWSREKMKYMWVLGMVEYTCKLSVPPGLCFPGSYLEILPDFPCRSSITSRWNKDLSC